MNGTTGFGIWVFDASTDAKAGTVARRNAENVGWYAIVYLAEGGGFFQSEPTGRVRLQPGSAFFLMPGVGHSYGPEAGEEWLEYFMLFEGDIPDMYKTNGLLSPANAVFQTATDPDIRRLWMQVMELARSRNPRLESRLSAVGLSLVCSTLACAELPSPVAGAGLAAVEHILRTMHERVGESYFDLSQTIADTGYSQTHIRRLFKHYTGCSPVEYFNIIKIRAAKRAMLSSRNSIRSIAESIGINEPGYFRRVFKRIEGVSPQEYRESIGFWADHTDK
ncbi:MAG: AraC family transcriptional regulator [Armatimonadota bacterium]|nr:AraC family transcriptional regulator [bacterium]